MFNLVKKRSNSHDYPYVTMPPEIHIKSLLPLLTPICIPAASCLNYIVHVRVYVSVTKSSFKAVGGKRKGTCLDIGLI